MTLELYLIARRTRDLAAALRFYVDVLGFERSHEVRAPGRHVVYVGPPSRAWAFQLVHDGGDVVVDAGEFVGLETGTFEADVAELRGRGATIDGPQVLPGGARYAFVSDPDGHRIRIIEKTGFLRGGVHGAQRTSE